MPEKSTLTLISLTTVFALFLVLIFHVASEDLLLFHSDGYSLSVYLASVSLVLGVVFFLICAPFYFFSQRPQRFITLSALLLFLMVLLFLVFNGFEALVREPLRLVLFKLGLMDVMANSSLAKLLYYRVIPIVVAVILGVFTIYALFKHKGLIVNRVVLLCRIVFIGMLIFSPVAIAYNYTVAKWLLSDETDEKHLILFVIDALPVQYTQTFNPIAKRNGFDEVFDKGHIIRHLYTIAPYTNGYFSTLYTGDPAFAKYGTVSNKKKYHSANSNLLKVLEAQKVAHKVISFHGNGIPEWTAARVVDYSGLRSFYLTRKTTWLPKLLGLNYHMNVNPRILKQSGKLFPHLSMYQDITFENPSEPYIDNLVQEIEQNQSKAPRSFTLVHLRIDESQELCTEERVPHHLDFFGKEFWAIFSTPKSERIDWQRQKVNEYEQWVERQMQCTGNNFANIIKRLQSGSYGGDSTILITADHGYLYDFDEGRFEYSYYPDEEVNRVSLVILNSDLDDSEDVRLFSTPDLTYSIFDYFNIDTNITGNAISVFDEENQHDRVVVLPRMFRDGKVWNLLVYLNNQKKWVFNIAPNGDGRAEAIEFDNYQILNSRIISDDELITNKQWIREAILQLALQDEVIHPRYLELIQ